MGNENKTKRKVVITTAASLLLVGSIGVSAFAANNMNTIKKNQLVTETSPPVLQEIAADVQPKESVTEDIQINGPVTESQAIEMAKQQLLRLFNVDVTASNLVQDVIYVDESMLPGTIYTSPVWKIGWITPQQLDENQQEEEFESHSVAIQADTGELVNAASDTLDREALQRIREQQDLPADKAISEETAEVVVLEFLEANGLTQDSLIQNIMLHDQRSTYNAKLTFANDAAATVVVNKSTGKVSAYEGDVEESGFPVLNFDLREDGAEVGFGELDQDIQIRAE